MASFKNSLISLQKDSLPLLALLLFINTFFFVAKQVPHLQFGGTPIGTSNSVFYFFFCILFLVWLALAWKLCPLNILALRAHLTRTLAYFLPTTLLLLYGISASINFHFLFQLGSGLLLILTLGLLFFQHVQKEPVPADSTLFREWFQQQGKTYVLSVLFFTFLFFSFSTYQLGKFAAVDEPLWLYGRIEKFWNNIKDNEWQKTDVSDKPGITVSIISGAGLLAYNPNEFDDKRFRGEVFAEKVQNIESFFFAFRFPIIVVLTLLLPLVYFFLERLLNKQVALFSYAFLSTSPILIGVAKIINPDALLWLFTTLSLLSYLVFQKRNWYRYLFLAGVFLGLALLTKYIANIIFIYLLGLVFLERLYHQKQTDKPLALYVRETVIQMGFVVFIALATFYLILPANWLEPQELIKSTLLSQAFEKVAPLFVAIIAILLLDQSPNKSRIAASIFRILYIFKESLRRLFLVIFFGSIAATLINTWAKMPAYDFMDLIASPKSIGDNSDILGIFLTNFYPMVFSLTPLALFGVLLTLPFLWKKNALEDSALRFTFYAIIFTLVYYLGATVNGVGSIIRYQIIVFPLTALMAGVGWYKTATFLADYAHTPSVLKKHGFTIIITLIGFSGLLTLIQTPFPLSYASRLLPNNYYVDLKDMGPGSYEIAQLLNTLPDAKNTLIWTDKDGVCQFFIGRCKRGNGREVITDQSIDYVVISSARESRTTHMIRSRYDDNPESVVPIHLFYLKENPDFEVKINNRPSHYVRAFKYEGN